jgi:hypothetical protein
MRARLSRVVGAPTFLAHLLPNIANMLFHFAGGRPLHKVQFLFSRSRGVRPLHKVQYLTFRNPLDIPAAGLTNSSPKAFLSNTSDVLSILRCSYRLVPGSIIQILLSGPLRHVTPVRLVIITPAVGNFHSFPGSVPTPSGGALRPDSGPCTAFSVLRVV